MNKTGTFDLVKEYGVVPLKADRSPGAPNLEEIDKLMVKLGNTGRGIPFYAIFPGRGGPPITFDGLIFESTVLEKLREAGPSKDAKNGGSAVAVAPAQ